MRRDGNRRHGGTVLHSTFRGHWRDQGAQNERGTGACNQASIFLDKKTSYIHIPLSVFPISSSTRVPLLPTLSHPPTRRHRPSQAACAGGRRPGFTMPLPSSHALPLPRHRPSPAACAAGRRPWLLHAPGRGRPIGNSSLPRAATAPAVAGGHAAGEGGQGEVNVRAQGLHWVPAAAGGYTAGEGGQGLHWGGRGD